MFLIAIGEARKGLEPGILMDLLMPIMDGGEAARQPPMQVVAVNSYIFPEKKLFTP